MDLDPGRDRADAAEAKLLERVDGDEGRGLRQPVAFQDEQPDGVEELGDLLRQRRATGDEEPHPTAGFGDDLGEDELLGQVELESAYGLARQLAGAGRPADLDSPEEDLAAQAGAGQHGVHDLGVDLLEDPRRADHDVRPDLDEVLGDRLDALGIGHGTALVEIGEGDHSLQDMRQRQEGERGILFREEDHRRGGDDVADEVVVGQDDALGQTRGARGVDDGGLIRGLDSPGQALEEARLGGVHGSAFGQDLGQREHALGRRLGFQGDEMLDLDQLGPDGLQLPPLIGAGDDHDAGVGVIDEIFDLVGDERRVDRDGDAAQAEVGEVGHDPFGPVLGEDDELVALALAEGLKPQRVVPHGLPEFSAGDGGIMAHLLDQHELGLGIEAQSIQQQAGQRRDHARLLGRCCKFGQIL